MYVHSYDSLDSFMIFYTRLFLLEGFSRTRPLESFQDLNVKLGIQTKLLTTGNFFPYLVKLSTGLTKIKYSYFNVNKKKSEIKVVFLL